MEGIDVTEDEEITQLHDYYNNHIHINNLLNEYWNCDRSRVAISICSKISRSSLCQSLQRLLNKKNEEGDLDCEEESRTLMLLQLQSYCTDSLDELDLIKQVRSNDWYPVTVSSSISTFISALCTVLYCIVSYCTILHWIVLYCTVLYTVLYCILLCTVVSLLRVVWLNAHSPSIESYRVKRELFTV